MFKKLSETEIYRNSVIRLVKISFEDQSGSVFEREVVRHIGAVGVVPLLDDERRVVLMSQFRAALGRNLIEITAGKCDVEGESFELTAMRELEEELGIRCSQLIKLCEFDNSPGFTDEHSVSYLARGLSLGNRDPQSVEEQYSTMVVVELSKVPMLISNGTITDAKTIIGLSRAIEYCSSDQIARRSLFTLCNMPGQPEGNFSDSSELTSWCEALEVL